MAEQPRQTPALELITIKEFLEKVPPGRAAAVTSLVSTSRESSGNFLLPVIELDCDTPACDGIRFFEPMKDIYLGRSGAVHCFAWYQCRNCKKSLKIYALRAYVPDEANHGDLLKYGEIPAFGPPIPARVISLLGAEREYYLKGRRAENQGLGIGAFAYYRRAVENQKNKILSEIIRVSEKIGASKEVIEDLNEAKNETQFSRAVAVVKHGIPEALLVNGHNPLTLLHSALSEGLHAQTDQQCLELATSIRVILTEFADRLATALKEEAELNAAVSRLLKANAAKPDDPNPSG
jgi:hypothetical protein